MTNVPSFKRSLNGIVKEKPYNIIQKLSCYYIISRHGDLLFVELIYQRFKISEIVLYKLCSD